MLVPVLGSSIFLYGSEGDAIDGAHWGGSGALVGIDSTANPSWVHLYAVTNQHVAERCPVARLVNMQGDPYVLIGDQSDWVAHPDGDDIALRPIGAVPEGDYWYIPEEKLLSLADLGPEGIGPGDDCLMVGRYINHEFRQFDRPVVRFGNIAMLPELVEQKDRAFQQESFLVDMRSQADFSGSPVFVYYEVEGWRYLPPLPEAVEDDPAAHIDALQERVKGRDTSGVMGRTWLLGIDWGHLPVWEDVFDSGQSLGRMRVNSGMAGVVPAWKLSDLLNEDGVKMARDKAEKQLAERDEGAAVLDAASSDEFARFEDLTRKLVQVPKRELEPKPKKSK